MGKKQGKQDRFDLELGNELARVLVERCKVEKCAD